MTPPESEPEGWPAAGPTRVDILSTQNMWGGVKIGKFLK